MTTLLPDKYARIDNQFVFNARYRLPAREQKIILHIISKINPLAEKEFHKQRVSIAEMRQLLTRDGGKYGSFYSELATIAETMTNCKITFPSRFEINGMRLKGAINWFQHCIPVEDENGEVFLEFVFSEILKPFLIDLKEYVKIGVSDVFPMRSGYAIRMFQILKAEFDRLKEFKKMVNVDFSLDELKQVLGIDGDNSYPDFKNFRVRVLDPIYEDINQFSSQIQIEYEYLKTGKKITGIRFLISGKGKQAAAKKSSEKSEKTTPSVKNAETAEKTLKTRQPPLAKILDKTKLTRAQLMAADTLVKFGVFEEIALKKILPTVGGSEIDGFEDVFVQKVLNYFQQNAHQQATKELSAQTLVVWWLDKKVFGAQSKTGVWSQIMEELVAEKKKMEKQTPETYQNRVVARTMTNADFEKWYWQNKPTAKNVD